MDQKTTDVEKTNSSFFKERDISSLEAARLLGISEDDVKNLERQGLLYSSKREGGTSSFSLLDIQQIKSNRGFTLSDEAAQVNAQLQRETVSTLLLVRNVIFAISSCLIGYSCLILLLTVLFTFFPLQVAKWLGYTINSSISTSLSMANQKKDILGVSTRLATEQPLSIIHAIVQPAGRASLEIVKYVNPTAYERVAEVVILNPNDVLRMDRSGSLSLQQPIKLPESEFLEVGDTDLVPNLNSQYLQGKKPGTNVGDIAVIGENGSIEGFVAPTGVPGVTTIETPIPTTAVIQNGSLTVTAGSGLTGGGTISLGSSGALSISAPTCTANERLSWDGSAFSCETATSTTSGDGALIADTGLTLSGTTTNRLVGSGDVTIAFTNTGVTASSYGSSTTIPTFTVDAKGRLTSAGSNTISGLTTTNFSASAGITNGQLANSSFTINTSGPLGGGGSVSLGDALTLTCSTCTTSGSSLFSAIATTGSNSVIAQGGSLTLTAGSNISTSNNGSGAITFATSSTPTFTTVNGLTFTANATGFSIAGGTTSKTLTLNNSLSFTGTDGTTITFPGTSDTVAGLGTEQTFTKPNTFSPGSNAGVALTVASTTNATPSDAVNINVANTSGTATNGLLMSQTGGGTVTNGINVTQGSGTITNALRFIGTFASNLIAAPNLTVTNGGAITANTYNGITIGSTIQPGSSGAIALQSNGANTVTIDTGASGSTINIGNTNAAAISLGNATQNTTLTLTGTGLTTLGGNLTFSGASARTITGPNTGAAGALTLTTTGSVSGLTLNTANATSANSGAITIQSGSITTSGTSGNVALEVGTGATLGTIQIGASSAAPISIGTSTTAAKTITIGETANATTQLNLHSGSGYTMNGSTGVIALKGGAAADITTLSSSAGTGLTIQPAAPSSANAGSALTLKGGDATTTGNGGAITIDGGTTTGGTNGIISMGTTNASSLTIGRSSVTTTINGIGDVNNLKIGSGTTILKHLSATNTFDAPSVALGSCGDIGTVTVTGAAVGDTTLATPTATSGGIETLLLIWSAYVSSTNTVTVRACSVATLGGQNPGSQTWRADVWQH